MQVPITTTLPQKLVEEMQILAKETGKKKNQIIEESISQFLLNEKKMRMSCSFKKASLDKEIVELAEEGLYDYNEQLNKLKI